MKGRFADVSPFPSSLPSASITPLLGGATLRWAVLAPGHIAHQWVDAVHRHTEQRVVAVASRSLDRAQSFARNHAIERAHGSYEQLVEDAGVDAVYIASPHSEHARLALLAIAAGKHVLIEKPIAATPDEARQIADAARSAGVFAMEAMWSRFLPQSSIIDQLLADGAFGDVRQVQADFSVQFEFDPASRLFDPALAGGALLDLGVYPGWFIHFTLGAPRSITALGSLASTGVDEQSVVIGDHGGGAQSVLTTSLSAQGNNLASVVGTRARLDFTTAFMGPGGFRLTGRSDNETLEWTDTSDISWQEGLCYQAAAMAQHVADGLTESPLHTLDDAIEVLEVLHEARTQLGAK